MLWLINISKNKGKKMLKGTLETRALIKLWHAFFNCFLLQLHRIISVCYVHRNRQFVSSHMCKQQSESLVLTS